MATFQQFNSSNSNFCCWLCNMVQTWCSTSAEGVYAAGATMGKLREELRAEHYFRSVIIRVIIKNALHKERSLTWVYTDEKKIQQH